MPAWRCARSRNRRASIGATGQRTVRVGAGPATRGAAESLLATLAESKVHAQLAAMPGYDLSMSGERRLAA